MTAAKRELIDTGKDKRYVRRTKTGQFKESDDVGKSLSRIYSVEHLFPGANTPP